MVLLAAVSPAAAQTIVDERVWLGLSIQERSGTARPWRWAVETQLRTRDGVDTVDVFTVRPSIGYDLTSRSSIWLGYVASSMFPDIGGVRQEHRLVQQYTWIAPASRGTLSSRVRLEERFIEGDGPAAWRVRELVRYVRPVSSGSRTSWVAWDELLVHLRTTTHTTRGVDQNRVFLGLSRSFGSSMRIEAGYLNQFINGHEIQNRMNHILSVSLALTY